MSSASDGTTPRPWDAAYGNPWDMFHENRWYIRGGDGGRFMVAWALSEDDARLTERAVNTFEALTAALENLIDDADHEPERGACRRPYRDCSVCDDIEQARA